VQRIFRLNSKPVYPIAKIILTTCIVLTVAVLSTFADWRQQKTISKQEPAPQHNNYNNSVTPVETDTTPVVQKIINEEPKKARIIVGDTTEAIPFASEKLVPTIINDLVRDNLITDKENVTFTISPEKMIINSVQQPAEIHRKYKKKYLTEPDITIEYEPEPHPGNYVL
jgi:hypothetical protein